ncbi:uncharacterized protein [Physcomitrium patens]|uniref:FAM192A/Fyv6 N-terminal domain-containing protein n=2 Tax=Physcomitrium patens TaxID=3218 RepID=A0A2K1L4A4_PHYPA|nr:protein FAM192A-like isoform X2 [Physcomitrium patens]XP_024365939.1 protein FAM192A-like isoform X2 [Physcomitrium patens]XP_024365943.1 protein FAM192A-like isoform X2 [Physcomitrium patens]XP_024365947.1 protein FAM192A-like isoform X2 [Physcomitrium patens]XP_024365955.1 protein FAM192A-like isoform X2 [Physcomitrium patens]PNR60868.1 hypothetical protein PHYPA_003661 [Physcomitrium patens]|eukprot:XP_024365929.1 protein FAM192A-like isoform X2 [Physcomitrella patens]
MAEPKLKLLNFVSATQTDAENESASDTKPLEIIDNRPLYEILKENSDKKEAEFNERFKHRPPKALDEDETEFLDAVETYRKQQEQEAADAEARELTNFHNLIANRTITTEEVKASTIGTLKPDTQKPSLTGKRPQPKSALPIAIKIKSQSKKARIESPPTLTEKELNDSTAENAGERNCLGLVAYSDESGDE